MLSSLLLLVVFLATSLTGKKSDPGSSNTPKAGASSSSAAADPSGSATPIVLNPDTYYGKQYPAVASTIVDLVMGGSNSRERGRRRHGDRQRGRPLANPTSPRASSCPRG